MRCPASAPENALSVDRTGEQGYECRERGKEERYVCCVGVVGVDGEEGGEEDIEKRTRFWAHAAEAVEERAIWGPIPPTRPLAETKNARRVAAIALEERAQSFSQFFPSITRI